MQTMFSNFIIVRKDKFILHTKRISFERAKWLFAEAYKKVDSRTLRAKYLAQWGNVWRPDYLRWDVVKELSGVYMSTEGFLSKASDVVGKKMLKNFEEFLSKPIEPKKFERHPRPPIPPMRYTVVYDHVRYSRMKHTYYTVPDSLDFYAVVLDDEDTKDVGISVFSKTLWLWYETRYEMNYEEYDEYKTLIVRRDLSPSEVKKFVNVVEPPLVKAVVKYREDFEYAISKISDKYSDVKELAKVIIDAIVESAGNPQV